MSKKILVLSGSPKKNGNTAALIEWFSEGAGSRGASIELVYAAFLKYKFPGCTSCRACQEKETYGCVIDDDANPVLRKMADADVIVMATPLYFFSASAQLKVLIDRMFSLYKWDNAAGTMRTALGGKTLVLLASAYENVGLDALEKPFVLTAEYTGMKYVSFLVPGSGVSGDIRQKPDLREKIVDFGKQFA